MTATTIAPAFDMPALVACMPTPEWGTALYASDMPTDRADHSPAQVVAWIAQGTERLGGELAVWGRTLEFRKALNARDDAAWARVFPKGRRQDRAWDVAQQLDETVKAAGSDRYFPTVEVRDEVMGYDGREEWLVRVPVRDLEMAR